MPGSNFHNREFVLTLNHMAARFVHFSCVKRLILAGADLDSQGSASMSQETVATTFVGKFQENF